MFNINLLFFMDGLDVWQTIVSAVVSAVFTILGVLKKKK